MPGGKFAKTAHKNALVSYYNCHTCNARRRSRQIVGKGTEAFCPGPMHDAWFKDRKQP